MTKRAYTRTINPPKESKAVRYPDMSDLAHQKALRKADERNKLIAVADKLAGHPHCVRNYKYSKADLKYPNDPDMRIVEKCYPYAKGGMLLVDEPTSDYDSAKCFEKQKVLKELGFRHVVIERDTTLYDALEQLGEI
jgi:hypothetical protein